MGEMSDLAKAIVGHELVKLAEFDNPDSNLGGAGGGGGGGGGSSSGDGNVSSGGTGSAGAASAGMQQQRGLAAGSPALAALRTLAAQRKDKMVQ